MARKLGVHHGQDDEAFFRAELKRAHEYWRANEGRGRQAWIVRPFPHKIRRVEEFVEEEVVAIGWPKLPDLAGRTEDEIRGLLLKHYGYPPAKLGQAVGTVSRFMQINEGDIVIAPEKGQVSVGEVRGAYRFNASKVSDGYPHQYSVRWLCARQPLSAQASPEAAGRLRAQQTVLPFDVSTALQLWDRSPSKVSTSPSVTPAGFHRTEWKDLERKHAGLYEQFAKRFSQACIEALTPTQFFNPKDDGTFCYWVEYMMPGRITGRRNYWENARSRFPEAKALLLKIFNPGMTPEKWFALAHESGIKDWKNVVPTKILSCYFPDRVIPVFKPDHRIALLAKFGIAVTSENPIQTFAETNRAFVGLRDSNPAFSDWPLYKLMFYLYSAYGKELKAGTSNREPRRSPLTVGDVKIWHGEPTRVEPKPYERDPQHDLLLDQLCQRIEKMGKKAELLKSPGKWAADAVVEDSGITYLFEVKAVATGSMREFYEAVGQLYWYSYQVRKARPGTNRLQKVICSTLPPTEDARCFLENDQDILCLWANGEALVSTEKGRSNGLLSRILES